MPHRPDEIGGRERRGQRERDEEGGANTRAIGEHAERERRQHGRDPQHRVETQEQQQAEEHASDRREKAVTVDVGAGVGEERGKEQRLHHHLGVGITREPDLDDVQRQECRGDPRGRSANEPAAGEVHRQHPEDRPDTDRAPRAGETVEAVADRDRRRKQVRKLTDDRAGVGVLDRKSHKPQAVVVGPLVRRKEQVARERRHRRHDRIHHHDRAALRDLNPLVHVHSGILAADDVFRRWEEAPEPEQDQRQREQRRQTGPERLRTEAQPEPASRRRRERQAQIRDEQPLEAVAVRRAQSQDDGQRHHGADDHGPEEPLLGVERRALVAVRDRQAEDHRSGQPADDE